MEQPPLLGIDIGATKMLMVAKGPDHVNSDVMPTGPDITVSAIEAAINGFISQQPCAPRAIAIAVAGLVDESGRVVSCKRIPNLLNWDPQNTLGWSIPIIVSNDANAALTEETHDLPSKSTAAVVVVGTGTGAGLMVDGKLLSGARGWAGEIGTNPIMLSHCETTSLNNLAGGESILRDLGVTADVLSRLLIEQDKHAVERVQLAGTALGLSLATLINVLNPHRVVFGGRTSTLPYYAEAVLVAAKANSFSDLWNVCDVRCSRHGGMLVALGALRLASESSSKFAHRIRLD